MESTQDHLASCKPNPADRKVNNKKKKQDQRKAPWEPFLFARNPHIFYMITQARKEYVEQWRKDNRERDLATKRAHYQANKDKYKKKARDWICKNRERHLHTKKIQRRKTLAKGRAWKAKHRAKRLNAIPPWADLFVIQTIYEKAHQKTQETGIKHVVDHIIPLQGERVSGLHVVGNLQIITDRENRAKGNKLLFVCPINISYENTRSPPPSRTPHSP